MFLAGPVFIDEAYLECSTEFAERTLIDLVRDGHEVCLMRTFSKIYGMAGQRIGYGVMPHHMAQGMEALPQHMWTAGNLNRVGVVGAIASLKSEGYVEETRASIKAERDQLETLLGKLGRRYAKSHANFVWFETGMDNEEFKRVMAAHGVVAARAFPPMEDWCRLSVGLPEEMEVAREALVALYGGEETVDAEVGAAAAVTASKL